MVRRMSECSCLKGMIFNIPSMGHNDFKSQRVEDGQSKGISWMQRFHSWRHSSCQYLPAGVTSTRPAQDWDHHKWSIMNGREALEASIPPEGLMSLMMTETKRAIFFGKLPMLPHIHSLLFNYVLAIDRVWKNGNFSCIITRLQHLSPNSCLDWNPNQTDMFVRKWFVGEGHRGKVGRTWRRMGDESSKRAVHTGLKLSENKFKWQ